MRNTLIIQSHRSPLPYIWIETCMKTVRLWCQMNGYEYLFIDDALFDLVPTEVLSRTQDQKIIATDLARLLHIQNALEQGYQSVVWLDADFMVFNPDRFNLPSFPYALGREVWVQEDKNKKLKVYKKVHNAFLMFSRNNSFLDFYVDTAQRLILSNNGTMPPQFVGPKLLTALHNICGLPVMETAGMLSPMVIKSIILGEGIPLQLFKQNSPEPIAGANLCISSCTRLEVSELEMNQLISILSEKGLRARDSDMIEF